MFCRYKSQKDLLEFLESHKREEIPGHGVRYTPLRNRQLLKKPALKPFVMAVLTLILASVVFGAVYSAGSTRLLVAPVTSPLVAQALH